MCCFLFAAPFGFALGWQHTMTFLSSLICHGLIKSPLFHYDRLSACPCAYVHVFFPFYRRLVPHFLPADTLELEVDVEKSDSGLFLNSIKERVAGRQNEPLWVPSAEQLPTQPLSREDIRDWLQEESLWSW